MRRWITGLVLVGVLVPAILWLPSLAVLALAVVITEGAMIELSAIASRLVPGGPYRALLWIHPAIVVLYLLSPEVPWAAPGAVFALLLLCSLVVMVARVPLAQAAPAAGLMSLAAVYLAVPVISVYALHRAEPALLFLVALLVGVGDTAAFLVGSRWGQRPLAPRLSPKKTWEGSIAGLLASLACGFGYGWWQEGDVDPRFLLVVTLAAVGGQIGDLFESMWKRGAGVKDSGTWLPGHGGLLDRFDALFFAAPLFWLGSDWLAR